MHKVTISVFNTVADQFVEEVQEEGHIVQAAESFEIETEYTFEVSHEGESTFLQATADYANANY